MEKPLVSVLLASYNHQNFVEASVRSIINQKGVSFELIVIDDGSSDDSPKILERLAAELNFKYIHRKNCGLIQTLNQMLELAQGKYYCTFASDDIMPPNRLKWQSEFLENHPKNVACFGQVKSMTVDGIVADFVDDVYLKAVPKINFKDFFLGKKPLHGCAEMFVTDAVKNLGGYDSKYFFEDYPLFLKILDQYGSQPVLKDLVCCYYRIHGNNLHANHNRMYAEFFKIILAYKNNPLYKQAEKNWKANWFSALAFSQKKEAIKKLPYLATFSLAFFKRFPKLFIPQKFLKY